MLTAGKIVFAVFTGEAREKQVMGTASIAFAIMGGAHDERSHIVVLVDEVRVDVVEVLSLLVTLTLL